MAIDPDTVIAGLRAQIDSLTAANRDSIKLWAEVTEDLDNAKAKLAAVTTERDALAASALAVRGLVEAESETAAEAAARIKDLEAKLFRAQRDEQEIRDAMAASADALKCGHSANAIVDAIGKLRARVAELEERPVLTVERLADALDASYGIDGTGDRNRAEWVVAHLGAVTLPAFAGVSVEELIKLSGQAYLDCPCRADGPVDCCNVASIRAVLARLKVATIAPVDPEGVARMLLSRPWAALAQWGDLNANGRAAARDHMRAALIAAGIPVTPEAAK